MESLLFPIIMLTVLVTGQQAQRSVQLPQVPAKAILPERPFRFFLCFSYKQTPPEIHIHPRVPPYFFYRVLINLINASLPSGVHL